MAVKFSNAFNLTFGGKSKRAFPRRRCCACGAAAESTVDLCAGCHSDLALVQNPCEGCGIPLPVAVARCATCQRRPRRFDACRAPFAYAPPIDILIQRMKFDGDLRAARVLGRLMSEQLKHVSVQADFLMPVPLHPRRLIVRGYNQSLELAKQLGASLEIPLLRSACRRVRATLPQTAVSARERRVNVQGAFQATFDLDGLRVALVDDVMTSGHTAEAVARELKRAGAVSVYLWACARAGGRNGR